MEIQEADINRILPYPNNPRKIPEEAIEKVANSIREFGFRQPIVVDRDNVVIVGHTRLLAAKRLGMTTVPVVVAADLTPEQAKAYRLADNRTGEISDWDDDKLFEELDDLFHLDFDMSEFGFESPFDDDDDEEPEEDDYDGSVPDSTDIRRGDIFRLGDHILMCGDSTLLSDVRILMGGGTADMCLTDPPYNVALGMGGSKDDARKRHRRKDGLVIMNDSMDDESFREFLVAAFSAIRESLRAGGAFYIWHADNEGLNFRRALREAGLQQRQTLIWNKNAFTLGRQDYQWKHEPCLYGWKDGAPHYFVDDRTLSTVIDCDKPQRSEEHPTMKPVTLMAALIQHSSRKGDTVLDPFGGSGTTLIACEELGRKCRMMELDPRYCQVIINRWEKLTGRKAERISA